MNKQAPKEFWIIFAVFCCLLLPLLLEAVFGKLPLQTFAILAVLLCVVPFLRYWKLFQIAAKDQPPIEGAQKTLLSLKSHLRTAKVRIVMLCALTCLGMWETRGGPWVPRVVGLGFLLVLLAGNILSLQ